MDGSSSLSVRVLGPVSVSSALGPVAIGGPLVRGFLAVVATESPRPVSTDRLTALLWGDEAPASVKAALQQLATRVRRALAHVDLAAALQAVAPGYALVCEEDVIDVRAFRAGVRDARQARLDEDPLAESTLLTEALDHWRGPAFEDLVDLPLSNALAPGLDDERWRAEQARAEALLACGRADAAVEALASATSNAPLREGLWILQARALAASGRVADAIVCARTGAAVITAQLGVPPGPEFARIEAELLRTPVRTPAPTARRRTSARTDLLDGALHRAMHNAEAAAEAAAARLAPAEAARHWERALELLDACAPDDQRHRLRMLLGLGTSLNATSLDAEVRRVLFQAIELARELDDPIGFSQAVLGYCAERNGFLVHPEHRVLLEEALAWLPADEEPLRVRVMARLATDLYWTGAIDTALAMAEEAQRDAEAASDEEGRLLSLYAVAFGCWTPDRADRLVTVVEQYLAAAEEAGDRRHQMLAYRWLATAATELGDVARGQQAAASAITAADELGVSGQHWIARLIAAAQQLVVGDLTKAEAWANESLTLGSVVEPEVALDYYSLFIWTLRWLQGRLDEVAELVKEVASTPGVNLTRRMGLAVTHAELGELDAARQVLDGVHEPEVDALPRDAAWYTTLAAMAEAAALTDHHRTAAIAYERLRPYRDRIAISTLTATGPVAHHIGIAAWAAGHHDVALQALFDSVALADAAPAPVFGTRSRLALADRLSSIGRSDEAAALAEEAVAARRRLGLVGNAPRSAHAVQLGVLDVADRAGR